MMEGYRKFRGWSGKIYWVHMSEEEIRTRNRIKMLIAVPVGAFAFVFGCALAAGMIKIF